jgi:hypothetical protein
MEKLYNSIHHENRPGRCLFLKIHLLLLFELIYIFSYRLVISLLILFLLLLCLLSF